jgi:hypothetical protein
LLAHINFEDAEWPSKVGALVENTLAYHVADDEQRKTLRELFDGLAQTVMDNVPDAITRENLRRSPLPGEIVMKAAQWLEANRARLQAADTGDKLFDVVYEFIANEALPAGLQALSEPAIIPQMAKLWLAGATYEQIYKLAKDEDLRTGGNKRRVVVDDIVGLCESDFGYDVAMTVATMADILETSYEDISARLSVLQRRLKYGLASEPSAAFFETGFADRKIAAELGALFPIATERTIARATVRQNRNAIAPVLSAYPSYFSLVFNEIVGE